MRDLNKKFDNSLGYRLRDSLLFSIDNSLGHSLGYRLRDSLWFSLGNNLSDSLRDSLDVSLNKIAQSAQNVEETNDA